MNLADQRTSALTPEAMTILSRYLYCFRISLAAQVFSMGADLLIFSQALAER
jgi:hypothetical protein